MLAWKSYLLCYKMHFKDYDLPVFRQIYEIFISK